MLGLSSSRSIVASSDRKVTWSPTIQASFVFFCHFSPPEIPKSSLPWTCFCGFKSSSIGTAHGYRTESSVRGPRSPWHHRLLKDFKHSGLRKTAVRRRITIPGVCKNCSSKLLVKIWCQRSLFQKHQSRCSHQALSSTRVVLRYGTFDASKQTGGNSAFLTATLIVADVVGAGLCHMFPFAWRVFPLNFCGPSATLGCFAESFACKFGLGFATSNRWNPGVLAMGAAVAKQGWLLGALLIVVLLAAWSSPKASTLNSWLQAASSCLETSKTNKKYINICCTPWTCKVIGKETHDFFVWERDESNKSEKMQQV